METKLKEQNVVIGYRLSRTLINVSHHCHLDLHALPSQKCYSGTGDISSKVVGYDHDLGHPNPNQVVPPSGYSRIERVKVKERET